jgi:hypothetical protein
MRYLPLLLLTATLPAFAELRIETLETKRSNWELYRFPLLSGDSPAVERINTFLHATQLNSMPSRFEHSPFERVWPKKGEIAGVTSLDYQVDAKAPGFLSLTIQSEYTNAYSSMRETSYVFDLASGQPIVLEQLLTAEGLQRLGQRLSHARVKRIENFLAGHSVPSGHGGGSVALRGEDEDGETQRDIYQSCIPYRRDGDIRDDRLQLGEHGLTLTAESCAAHVVRALDDLGDFRNELAYEELAADLSRYGRCLLLERRSDCQRPVGFEAGGVYKGRIGGRYPITLIVGGNHGGRPLFSAYFYDKYARYIELSNQVAAAQHLQLRESGEPPAMFDLELRADDSVYGTWQQDGKAAVAVELR